MSAEKTDTRKTDTRKTDTRKVDSRQILKSIFEKETPLKKLAENAVYRRSVPAAYPSTGFDVPTAVNLPRIIYTLKMKGAIWGEPHQTTLSLLKTDVFDRRYIARHPMTVDEIVKGAFSEANKDLDDMPKGMLVRANYGALVEEGGRKYNSIWSFIYPFPCQKPVGQIAVRALDMKGAAQPESLHHMSNGLASVHLENKKDAILDLDYLMSMKRNIIAVNAGFKNLQDGVSFRLYRNQDQGHRKYMDENGNYIPKEDRKVFFQSVDPSKPIEYYDLEGDADINGPFEPPKCGKDGRFFWVSQRFPAERTFPEGFEYVMMGIVSDANDVTIRLSNLQKNLGSAPGFPFGSNGKLQIQFDKGMEGYESMYLDMEKQFELVRKAPGVAATADLPRTADGSVRLYVTVVTSNELKRMKGTDKLGADDIFEEAKKQLLEAESMGFEALVKENRDWYDALYDRREEGRIVVSASGKEKEAIDNLCLNDTYVSWAISDGGHCDPDPGKYEGSENHVAFDVDTQSWHSLPCYNEIFSEPMVVHNHHERVMYYCRLIDAWHGALKEKASVVYGLPGMVFGHGYLPPALPDPWYMENLVMDLCFDVPAQVLKVMWNVWDYRGDVEMLKNSVYPPVRDLAIFFEAFARRNYDGIYFNLAPVVETENWGISYRLKHTTNTTGALTMFRKILKCAIEGAELLGVDAELIPGWREVAENLAPYPKFLISSGEILGGNPGAFPRWAAGDHPWFTGDYPASLADEINLDSPQELKDLIARTNDTIRTNENKRAYILVGKFKDHIPCCYSYPAIPIEGSEMLFKEVNQEPERLINSRSGRIHLFPAVPDRSEVAFRELLTRGGFGVSAARDKDGVKAVLIRATRSIPCRIMNPWATYPQTPNTQTTSSQAPNPQVPNLQKRSILLTDNTTGKAVPFKFNADNGECIIFDAEAGHEYSLDISGSI